MASEIEEATKDLTAVITATSLGVGPRVEGKVRSFLVKRKGIVKKGRCFICG